MNKAIKFLQLFITISISSILFISCGKSDVPDVLVQVDADFVIDANLNTIETHYYFIRDVPVFYSTTLNNRNIDDTNANVRPYSASMLGLSSDINYDYLQDITISAVSIDNPNIKREMFYLENIPFTEGPRIELFPTLTELKSLMQNDLIDLEIRINLKKFVPLTYTNRITFKYSIN